MFSKILSFCTLFSCVLLVSTLTSSSALTNETDLQALLAIRDLITADPFGGFSSWNDSIHFCKWKGVTCSRHQRVTVLDLGSLQLVGSLSPYIGNLSFLNTIYLENNSFHGAIPEEIGRLFRLEYLLAYTNSFQGELPANITQFSSLIWLNVYQNKLTGSIPEDIGSLSNLQALHLWKNHFTGIIPPTLGNLSSLTTITLSENHLEGSIPFELGQLTKLESFQIHSNNLTGIVPPTLYNISSIFSFDLTENQFYGKLPPDLGLTMPNLKEIYIGGNRFSGPIPPSIANASKLVTIDVPWNRFTGPLPLNFGSLRNLKHLNLLVNKLGTAKPNDLDFLQSLVNCTNLELFQITRNGFAGNLPDSITNLSVSLTTLRVDHNYISGSIPQEIGNLVNLVSLAFNENKLSGSIPESVGKLTNLQGLFLYRNNISGEIPSSISNISGLSQIAFQENLLEGSIPVTLGNMTSLQALDLQHNRLSGVIPDEIMGLSSLTIGLFLNQNQLTGSLPSTVGSLRNLGVLNIAGNKLTGGIPSSLGSCLLLEVLYMQDNNFEGTIPSSFRQFRGIQLLDLSQNKLSGKIPSFLGDLLVIRYLNISNNLFEGEVPTEGVFKNISQFSVVGNLNLCGGTQALKLPNCPNKIQVKKKDKSFFPKMLPLVIVLPAVILLASVSFIVWQVRKSKHETSSVTLPLGSKYPRLSYTDLFRATNGFVATNLIGEGKYGYVYKGTVDEQIVAVKVLKLQQHGADKSFLAECQILRNIRHRNVVKIITSCSTIDHKGSDFKALVFEYMPNGSLEDWLHPTKFEPRNPKNLSLVQRLNVAIDVASALDYLHHHGETAFCHCDLKPSNVLLDENLCAHVGDFGLARLLLPFSGESNQTQSSSIAIKGTIGYVPPEYGMGKEVSTQGDVYSFGILLLEMFTGKRPTSSTFIDGSGLHNHVKVALPDQVMNIVDQDIVLEVRYKSSRASKQKRDVEIESCLVSVLQVGLSCSVESPSERMDIADVIMELQGIQNLFLGVGWDEELELDSSSL